MKARLSKIGATTYRLDVSPARWAIVQGDTNGLWSVRSHGPRRPSFLVAVLGNKRDALRAARALVV